MNLYQLKQTAFRKHLERERQEWLAAGMTEADIYRVHFGEEHENGRGGDYRIWLDERKHIRTDHKYAPGAAAVIDTVDPDSAWISGGRGGLDEAEFNIDLEAALSRLTGLQRKYVTDALIDGRSYAELARRDHISEAGVRKHIKLAMPKLKKFFS